MREATRPQQRNRYLQVLLATALAGALFYLSEIDTLSSISSLSTSDGIGRQLQGKQTEDWDEVSDYWGARVGNNAQPTMDVVIVAGAINCATETTIKSLHKYLYPAPRNIHLILPNHLVPICRNVWKDSPYFVGCHSEQDVVPLTNANLQDIFAQKGSPWNKLGDRAGWYLQQFVKLLAYKELSHGDHAPLSSIFALWDADLVLQAPFHLFTEEGKVVVGNTGLHNIYHITTEALLGYANFRDDTVTHFCGMNTTKLDGLFGEICPGNTLASKEDVAACVSTIVANIPHDQPSPWTPNRGHEYAFSEYNLYHAYSFHTDPDSIEVTSFHQVRDLNKKLTVDCTVTKGSKPGDMHVFETYRAGWPVQLDKKLAAKSAAVARTKDATDYMKAFLDTATKPTCQNEKIFLEPTVTRWYCLDDIVPGDCTIYSFGMTNQQNKFDSAFDDFFHVYGCKVYSFDPSNGKKTHKRGKNHWFYSLGIGNKNGAHEGETTLYNKASKYEVRTLQSLMDEHGHDKIDILRMDVEGAEWELLGSLISSKVFDKVKYFSAELHMWERFGFHEYFYHFVSGIPMRLLWASRNTDMVNEETRKELSPGSGVTRVYEVLWGH